MKEKGDINKRALDIKGNDESIKKIKTEDEEKGYEKKNLNDAESKIDNSYSLYLEYQKGRNKNLKDNLEYIELLKKNARRKYLKEREKEKLDITKKLLDDELLYSTIKLDEKDIKELEFSKKIYDISKANVKLREKLQESYYTYQEDIDEKYSNLIGNILQQNDNNADPSLYNYDQQIINKGIMKFGSEAIQKNNFTNDFVFDTGIDYAKDTKREVIEDKSRDKHKSKDKERYKERDKKSEKKKYKEKHGEKYYNKHEMKSDKYKRYSSSDDSNSSDSEKISKSKKKKTKMEKEKKNTKENIKSDESEDEQKVSEMKNGLNSAVEFVHLESLSGMSEKEKELQKLFEDIQKNKEKKMKQIINERKRLPIYSYRYDILKAIKNNKILILVGETGSGKSTQLTQYLYECKYHLYGNIICTQPRRIACIAIANRVADEMNVKVGKEVGYVIRFQNKTSDNTKVIYMTDGMFLRLLLYNPTLEGISVLIIDEAHERALHTDVILPIV
ncbi:pre-mRNA-splicing factor ATP-dependent RNA helicase PRP2, putative (PRP2), partial [Plasmodium ovale curtisi]